MPRLFFHLMGAGTGGVEEAVVWQPEVKPDVVAINNTKENKENPAPFVGFMSIPIILQFRYKIARMTPLKRYLLQAFCA